MSALMGLDLGTTTFKASAWSVDGELLAEGACATPWVRDDVGLLVEPDAFAGCVRSLVQRVASLDGVGPVVGLGVTGMAETMFVAVEGARLLPARAWNHRGSTEEVPDSAAFARSGLVDVARAPVVELRRLRDAGARVQSWAGLPEQAVRLLGGVHVAERSLSARSGLVDVLAGTWDEELLAWAGVDGVGLPELWPAGRDAGRILEGPLAGAVLTVAGHDHLAASLGAGVGPGSVFDSLGTGEAVIAQVSLTRAGAAPQAVDRLREAGVNVGWGLQDDDVVALAGLGTGNRFHLLLQDLDAAGFSHTEVMDAQHAFSDEDPDADLVGSSGPGAELLARLFAPGWQSLREGDGRRLVSAEARDLDRARRLWWSAVVRASLLARDTVALLSELLPVAPPLVAAGGWLRNEGVRAVRERVLGPVTVPEVDQCGTRGAALLAGLAAGGYGSREHFPAPPTRRSVP